MSPEEQSAVDALQAQDLFGGLVLRWDPSLNVFVDLGGIPLSKTATKALRALIRLHMSKSPKELAQCADRALEEQMPSRKKGAPFDPERFA